MPLPGVVCDCTWLDGGGWTCDGDGSADAIVQHGNGDLLRAGGGDNQRGDELRGGVLHDGRDGSDDGLCGVQHGGDDFCDNEAAGDGGVPWRGRERGGLCDVHGECAVGADVQHGNGNILRAGDGDGA